MHPPPDPKKLVSGKISKYSPVSGKIKIKYTPKTAGDFKFENDLYYVLSTDNPVGAPTLYKLDKSWSVTTPTPIWQNLLVVIPGIGEVIVNNDTGNYSLFVNRDGVRSLLYSGSLGS